MYDEISTTLPKHVCSFEELPSGLHAAAVLGQNGDTKIVWDPQNEVDVEAAKTLFEKLVGAKGYLAFRVTDAKGEKGDQVKEFDARHERLIFAPRMVGG